MANTKGRTVALEYDTFGKPIADLDKAGCSSIDGVAAFLTKLITPGAQIYCEFREMRGGHRIAVLRDQWGTVILEPRNERRGFGYYVVTWYPKRTAHGTLVGTIQRPEDQ
ncbi:hypothetical protein D9M68_767150 [compost metagenome]